MSNSYDLELIVEQAQNLRNVQAIGKQDPYVICHVVRGEKPLQTSKTHTANDHGINPVWERKMTFKEVPVGVGLFFEIKDKNAWPIPDKHIGVASLDSVLWDGQTVEEDLPVIFNGKAYGTLTVKVRAIERFGRSSANPPAPPRSASAPQHNMQYNPQQAADVHSVSARMSNVSVSNGRNGYHQDQAPVHGGLQPAGVSREYIRTTSLKSVAATARARAGDTILPGKYQGNFLHMYRPKSTWEEIGPHATVFGLSYRTLPCTPAEMNRARYTHDDDHGYARAAPGMDLNVNEEDLGNGPVCITEIRKERLSSGDVIRVQDMIAAMETAGRGPHLLTLRRVWETRDHVYIVTDFCEGGELHESLIRNNVFGETSASRRMSQLLTAVEQIHSKGVVHRNIRPESVMLTSDAHAADVILAGWDFATVCEPYQTLSDMAGVDKFAAPEMFQGCYSHAADIWSCGVVLHILLQGQLPSGKVLGVGVDFQKGNWSHVSAEGKDFLSKMLTPKADRRATAAQLLQHPWLAKATTEEDVDPKVYNNLKHFAVMNKFKQMARQEMAAFMSLERIEELWSVFSKLDTDGSGKLSIKEAMEGLEKIDWGAMPKTRAEMTNLLKNADVNGDGQLSAGEFFALMMDDGQMQEEALLSSFTVFVDNDKEKHLPVHKRRITPASLEKIFRLRGIEIRDLARILAEADTNGDGCISFPEFKQMMTST